MVLGQLLALRPVRVKSDDALRLQFDRPLSPRHLLLFLLVALAGLVWHFSDSPFMPDIDAFDAFVNSVSWGVPNEFVPFLA